MPEILGRGWAQAWGGWGPHGEREGHPPGLLAGHCPHGAVGTGSSQSRVSVPPALGDAISSDLPFGRKTVPSQRSPKPYNWLETLPASTPHPSTPHPTPTASLELSSLCGPHPQGTQPCPSLPLPSSSQPHEQFPPPGPSLPAWGLRGTLWAQGWTMEKMRKCLLRQEATVPHAGSLPGSCLPGSWSLFSYPQDSGLGEHPAGPACPPPLRCPIPSPLATSARTAHSKSKSWDLRVHLT